jgi:hypothetical protein
VGRTKAILQEQDEQGWSFTDQLVCVSCVNDEAIEGAIEAAKETGSRCSFCGEAPAAPLDVLLEVFVNGLRNEYENALVGVSWDGREGGFQWKPTWDTWDLVGQFDDVLIGEGLLDAVREAVHDIT